MRFCRGNLSFSLESSAVKATKAAAAKELVKLAKLQQGKEVLASCSWAGQFKKSLI